jgi:hypothetical protein
LRQAGSGNLLDAVVKPGRREFREDGADTFHHTLRHIPSEDPLNKHIINFLLPKLQVQPWLRVTPRLLFEYLT